MAAELIGRRPEDPDGLSDPPVGLDELVAIVPALDPYALGLLAPLFLFGPRSWAGSSRLTMTLTTRSST